MVIVAMPSALGDVVVEEDADVEDMTAVTAVGVVVEAGEVEEVDDDAAAAAAVTEGRLASIKA